MRGNASSVGLERCFTVPGLFVIKAKAVPITKVSIR